MSTPHEITAQRTRRVIIALIAAVAVLALALAVAVGIALRPSADPAADGGGPSPAPSASPSIGDGPLALPEGGDQVDGRPVGFGHSPLGAVGMTAAYVAQDNTLDAAAKARTRQTYVLAHHDDALDQLTKIMQGMIESDLQSLGFDNLEADGIPTNAYVSALPLATVFDAVDEDTIEVVLLVQLSGYDGISEQGETLLAQRLRCLWREDVRGGDWVLDQEFPDIEAPEVVEPGTAAFEDSEWIELQGGVGS